MRVGILKIAACAALAFAAGVASAGDDILYWMVDSSATVEDTKAGTSTAIRDFFDSYDAPEGSAFAARVRVTGGNITEDTFLDLYWGTEFGGVDEGGGAWGVVFGDAGGYWGAGVPTGNQSPSGDYSAGTPEYSFIVELGNIDSSDNWTTVATSAAATYSSLGAYIHETFDINPGQVAVWSPITFTAVPEPSSGLLALMGFAILALRRRRKGA